MALHSIGKLRRGLAALAAVVFILYVLFAGVAIVTDRRATIARAESDMRNIAATLSEHAIRTFAEVDSRLRDAIADIDRQGLAPTPANERPLHQILVNAIEGVPFVGAINVIGANGLIHASSASYPMASIDSRDREYYSYLSDHRDSGMHISRPILSRASARWSIPVARRVDNPDGSLKMIVAAGVDMAYFDRLYRSLQLGESGRLLLVRRDGWLVMETPLTSGVMRKNVAGTQLFRQIERAPTGVYYTEHSMLDDSARVVGYASMPQSPVIAVASVGLDEVLAPWLIHCRQLVGIGAVSAALLLGLLRFLWLRLTDLETAQTSLASRNTELEAARRRFQELVDGIDGIVWEAELPGFRFTYVSGNAEAISGYDARLWVQDPDFWRDRLSKGADGSQVEPVLSADAPGSIKPIEHRIVAPDGREIWLRSNVMLAGAGRSGLQVRGVTVDITRQKQADLQLFQAIHIDPLTKLSNRRALVEQTKHALALAQHNHSNVGIILIDVDKFNTLNDSLGHEFGDAILIELGGRLKACISATDMLARIGGDEFAVVIEDAGHCPLKVEQLAERIMTVLRHAISVGDRELYLTVSMGIALFPQNGMDYQTLMRNADTALHRAKAAGRNGWQFFDSSMARQVEHRMDLETALRLAIEQNAFRLYYQPQKSLDHGGIVGAEALIRWERPGLGMVPPQEFINIAEENGSIIVLGTWVLQTACSQAAAWNRAGLRMRIAVNVSVVQLKQADFVEQVRHALLVSGLAPPCLELEITEGAFVVDVFDAVAKLHQIKAMGVELAIDDFGTGYSSLSYLKQMPFDRLKIDQSFVRDIPHNAEDCAIVRAILAMARNLGLKVIAEGVESGKQYEFLQDEGCNEIQGFYLSPPLPSEQFMSLCLATSEAHAT